MTFSENLHILVLIVRIRGRDLLEEYLIEAHRSRICPSPKQQLPQQLQQLCEPVAWRGFLIGLEQDSCAIDVTGKLASPFPLHSHCLFSLPSLSLSLSLSSQRCTFWLHAGGSRQGCAACAERWYLGAFANAKQAGAGRGQMLYQAEPRPNPAHPSPVLRIVQIAWAVAAQVSAMNATHLFCKRLETSPCWSI